MVKNFVAALLAAPLAASLLLAGCGGDPRPDAAASASSTRSPTTTTTGPTPTTTGPTTSPTASVPVLDPDIPAAARAHTPAGAEAFTRHFYAQVNLAWTRPMSGLIGRLGLGTCQSCAALEETASMLEAKEQRYDGDPLTVRSVGAIGAGPDGSQVVLLRATQEMRNVRDAQGRVALTDQRKLADFELTLHWVGAGWRVATVKGVR